jgi:CheY-like chemotaxis protein
MNESYADMIGQDNQPLPSALVYFLHCATGVGICPGDGTQTIVRDDNARKIAQYELPSEPDGKTIRVLLVGVSPVLGTTLLELLRHIDPRCPVTRTPRISEAFCVNAQGPSLVLIDLDAFPQNGDALLRAIATRQPGTPIITFSNSHEQKSLDVTVNSGIVLHLAKTSPRVLIEGVLRLVIDGERSRPRKETLVNSASSAL